MILLYKGAETVAETRTRVSLVPESILIPILKEQRRTFKSDQEENEEREQHPSTFGRMQSSG